MRTVHVKNAVSTLHVDTPAAAVAAHIAGRFTGYENARSRDVFYITAACVAAHYLNRARYPVALRPAV
jgi:hypothetical protein